jgi:enoyl-[acyl-carrier-protein] reductase (NADH)
MQKSVSDLGAQFNAKMDDLGKQLHGRIGKLSTVVLGDEEAHVIGLVEKTRTDEAKIEGLNRKWAIAIAVAVFLVQNLASYVSRRMFPQPTDASVVRLSQDQMKLLMEYERLRTKKP